MDDSGARLEEGGLPDSIAAAIARVEAPDPLWWRFAEERQAELTMPRESLGRLLEIGRRLAAIQRTASPRAEPALIAVFAADHGIADAGVSAYPSDVTAQMVANYLVGGAAVNVLAHRAGAHVRVVDIGVRGQIPINESNDEKTLIRMPIRAGTSNFLDGPAMSRDVALQAMGIGVALADRWIDESGYQVVALGEMGIGNTTSASALAALLTGRPADDVVGRGTGIDDATLARKREIVRAGLRRYRDLTDPIEAIAAVGGFEILGLAGLAIGAAARRSLVVLDGFISSVAALIAFLLCPSIQGSLLASHVGTEPGHAIVLESLGLDPLLDLDLRLGEGTGAALAIPIIAAAADILRDMATFSSAGVSGRVGT